MQPGIVPILPATLDEVVLRADWPDRRRKRLAEYGRTCAAWLLPFVGATHSLDEVGCRVSCLSVRCPAAGATGNCWCSVYVPRASGWLRNKGRLGWSLLGSLAHLQASAAVWLYFASVPEAVWGCSLGKFLMRLARAHGEGE